jgi:hypothetical protein
VQDDANQRDRHQHGERRVRVDVRGGRRLRGGPAAVEERSGRPTPDRRSRMPRASTPSGPCVGPRCHFK